MSEETINDFLLQAMRNGLFPSFSYLVGEKGEIRSEGASGMAVVEPEAIEASTETIYDLASLTKPLISGLLLGILIEQGEMKIDEPASRHLPELSNTDKRDVSLRQLVSHTSGLPAWHPFYIFEDDPDPRTNVLSQICRIDFTAQPGTGVIYSDVNFLLLGLILEKVTGLAFSKAAEQYILGPVGVDGTFFNPAAVLKRRIAANENGNIFEKKMCMDAFPGNKLIDSALRSEIIWGDVHDGNCFYLGGAAGHAGLFSTARETYRLAMQFLPAHSLLIGPDTCRLFQANITGDFDQVRSISFQLAATKDSSAGPDLPPEAFGHPGFTGTSVWVDGDAERVYVLLSNRTHNTQPPFPDLSETRRTFHSLSSIFLDDE